MISQEFHNFFLGILSALQNIKLINISYKKDSIN